MTRRITITPQAEDDLAEIFAYIATDNPAAARRLVATFEEKGELLAEFPGIGSPYPRRRARLYPVGSYLILYRETSKGIEVLRYVHGRRDLRRVL